MKYKRNYKLEFWPYGEFETAEAAERLNQRAAEGWELVNINGGSRDMNTRHVMWRFALYRRNPDAVNYRYTADIVSKKDGEDYVAFCRDGGWEKVVELNSGVCIFVSQDGQGRPLHTSREVEFEYQLRVLAENHVSTEAGTYLICIALMIGFLGWMAYSETQMRLSESVLLCFIPAYAVLWLKDPCVYCVNLLYIKYARRRAADGKEGARPEWMKKLPAVLSVLTAAILVYAVLTVLFIGVKAGASWTLTCAAAVLVAGLTAAGIWAQLFKNKAGLGNAFLIAGFMSCMIPYLFA